jgi:hypothetical protein
MKVLVVMACSIVVLATSCRRVPPVEEHAGHRVAVDAKPPRNDAEIHPGPVDAALSPGLFVFDSKVVSFVEWVDADVVRVKSLYALSVEANEIRCPKVQKSQGPVPKNMGWRRLEGDIVEVDSLYAHHVTARLVIADEIVARVVENHAKPYVWRGAGSGALVRNRLVEVPSSVDVPLSRDNVSPPTEAR